MKMKKRPDERSLKNDHSRLVWSMVEEGEGEGRRRGKEEGGEGEEGGRRRKTVEEQSLPGSNVSCKSLSRFRV